MTCSPTPTRTALSCWVGGGGEGVGTPHVFSGFRFTHTLPFHDTRADYHGAAKVQSRISTQKQAPAPAPATAAVDGDADAFDDLDVEFL
jgi:hypothetical protein